MKVTQSAIQTGSRAIGNDYRQKLEKYFEHLKENWFLLLPFYQMEMVVIGKGHGLKYKQDELGITDVCGISSLFFLNFLNRLKQRDSVTKMQVANDLGGNKK